MTIKRETIQYSLGQCELGPILTAHSDAGLCAVILGENTPVLENELQNRFPFSKLEKVEAQSDRTFLKVLQMLKNPSKKIEFALDERGTPFQLSVWKAVREIPFGKTVTYTDVAQKIGAPKAVRAVGTACAANPLAIVTPCHRVVRKEGGLAGYRWGLGLKEKLLELESHSD